MPQGVELSRIDPEFAEGLKGAERQAAEQFRLRTVHVNEGGLDNALSGDEIFGAVLVDGLLVHQASVGRQESLRLIGTGEVIVPMWGTGPLLAGSELHVVDRASLALLDDHALQAMQRWPRLATHLLQRMSEQTEEITAQMIIGHFPKVDDRVMAILWLIAQRFGRVTREGVLLPLAMKHSTIGALIGAQRPTVTLALHRLLDRKALERVEDGWLLLEQPHQEGVTEPSDINVTEVFGVDSRPLEDRRSREVQRRMLPASLLLARERAALRQVRAALEEPGRYDPWTTLRAVERRLSALAAPPRTVRDSEIG